MTSLSTGCANHPKPPRNVWAGVADVAVAGARIPPVRRTSGRCLPLAEWPPLDRGRWESAFAPTDLLCANPVAARWSLRSRSKTQKGYGRWLDWNLARGQLDPDVAPEARVTRERVAAYFADLQAVNSPHTVQTRLQELADAMRALAPMHDWRWLMAAAWQLRRHARSVRSKTTRMQSPKLLEALGLQLMAEAASRVEWPMLKRAMFYRDGLMIALLTRRPLRLKNFASIAIGHHLVGAEGRHVLAFAAGEMKSKRPYEAVLPAGLVDPLERYLADWRGILLTRGGRQGAAETDALWISCEGTPMHERSIYGRIVKLTAKAFGAPVNPHLFRDCTATAVAVAAPQQVPDVPALLGHTDPSTAERYYIQANRLEAARRYNAIIDGYRPQNARKRRTRHNVARNVIKS
jgi:site-specific recombinase XerD